MKLTSTQKSLLHNGRKGLIEEFIQIEITKKVNENQTYTITAVDSIVYNRGEENESTQQIYNPDGSEAKNSYNFTYAEFDAQENQLKAMFPSELTGSALRDYLLIQGALLQLQSDPIYGVEFEAR